MKQDARYSELMAMDGISLRAEAKRCGFTGRKIAKEFGVTESAVSMGFNDATAATHRTGMRKRIVEFIVKNSIKKKSATKLRAA